MYQSTGLGDGGFLANASVQEEIAEWAWCWDLIDLCMYGYKQVTIDDMYVNMQLRENDRCASITVTL